MKSRVKAIIEKMAFVSCLLALAPIRRVSAETPPRIVVVVPRNDLPFAERLAAELGTMGFFSLVSVSPEVGEPASMAETVAHDRDATAGVYVVLSAGVMTLHLYQSAPVARSVVREVARQDGQNGVTLAIRAAELVRATLAIADADANANTDARPSGASFSGAAATPSPTASAAWSGAAGTTPPVGSAMSSSEAVDAPSAVPAAPARSEASEPHPAAGATDEWTHGPLSGDPAASEASKGAVSSTPPSFTKKPAIGSGSLLGIEIGAGVLGSPHGLPPSPVLSVGAGWFVLRSVRVGAFGILPLSAMHHQAEEGSSDTSVTIGGVDVRLVFGNAPTSRWQAILGVGAALAALTSVGHGKAPLFVDRRESAFTAGPSAMAGVGLVLSPAFVVRAQANAGLEIPPFSIRYVEREAADWGMPWLAVWGGAELKLRLDEP